MANQCKFYKVVRQVSYDSGVTWVNIGETQKGDLYEYDSAECGAVTQYRWVDVTGAYTCEGTTKYQKTKKQVSTDGGTTWSDVSPAEYGKGDVIEYDSTDCGGGGGDYSNLYLTFVAIEDSRFKLSGNSVQYSIDNGSTWSTLASDAYSPTVYSGQKIMWKGNLVQNDGVGTFVSTGRFNVEGNSMSLLYGDNFYGEVELWYADFAGLFDNNTKLISAENLILPATTLSTACYASMFRGCTSLTTAPMLPATTLANSCYFNMFMNCTSLVTPPSLPATTLADACYAQMFCECHSLTTVPSLPATTLATLCYDAMFQKCISLTTVPSDLLPATTLERICYQTMFAHCYSLRTPPTLPATTLADWCYNGMFYACSSLTTVPALPATTLTEQCYGYMFYGCESLTTVPSDLLPATTLTEGCYKFMFDQCFSLTTAPVLPATTLVKECYEDMFIRCMSLRYIKCLATDISAEKCTYYWVSGVSSSGTFVKNSSMRSWTRGKDGIPNNWSIQNA